MFQRLTNSSDSRSLTDVDILCTHPGVGCLELNSEKQWF